MSSKKAIVKDQKSYSTTKELSSREQNHYKMLSDAYYGEGGFLDGSYLKQHIRETEENYLIRCELSYFLNYVLPTVNSHVDPLFKKDAQREYKETPLFEGFYDDCTGDGTDLPTFMKQAATLSKLKGAVLIVMDNAKDKTENIEDAIAQRKYPYIYIVEPENVVKYKISKLGTLTMVQYKEYDEDTEETYIREWTETGWRLLQIDGEKIKEIAVGDHDLKRVPVTVYRSRKVKPKVLIPTSEFMQIARANKNLFNKCSWEDEILMNQAFSILLYPSKQTSDLIIGTKNALGFDGANSNFAPSYIAPPIDPVTMLANNRETIITEIYRMAALSHVTGVEKQASGISKAWDFENMNMALSSFTLATENAENDIVKIWELWTKETIDYKAVYPRDFGILDLTASLDNAQKAIDLGGGKVFKIEVLKKIFNEYFPKADKAIQDKVLAELEQMALDESHAEDDMTGDGNADDNNDLNNDKPPAGTDAADKK